MNKQHAPALVLGFGTALPAHPFPQGHVVEWVKGYCNPTARQSRVLEGLYRATEIRQRHSVLLEEPPVEHAEMPFFRQAQSAQDFGPSTRERMERYAREAPALAHRASENALHAARTNPEAITHLITVSCTGFFAPGLDIALLKSLGLAPEVGRLHVGFMGCHGAFNGLRQAIALIQADRRACVLLCATELCSLHFQYGWDAQKLLANSLFADGAAALVLAASDDAPAADEALPPWRAAAAGSCIVPDSADAMTWSIGDHGFAMTLSRRVPDLIRRHLRPWLERFLETQGTALSDIRSWAIHPGGPRILKAVEEALGLPDGAAAVSHAVLAECGNMSSPTILFILERLRTLHAPCPCVALGFGPGLAAEAVQFT